ncbi:MAG: FMN-binding negative transcriptional regulator [Gemmatimonadales bacterium]
MYVPKRFAETDPAVIDAFIRDNGFATLVTAGAGEPYATHIPLELSRTSGAMVLEGHVARANPHWRELESGARCLAIFAGAHTYVSSSWYAQENVPTWNYMTVHAWGAARLVEDETRVRDLLRRLSLHYEPDGAATGGFDVDRLTPGFYGKEVRGIVAFEIAVDRVEASFKLSQNRDDTDHRRIIGKLRERGDESSRQIADAMEKRRGDP